MSSAPAMIEAKTGPIPEREIKRTRALAALQKAWAVQRGLIPSKAERRAKNADPPNGEFSSTLAQRCLAPHARGILRTLVRQAKKGDRSAQRLYVRLMYGEATAQALMARMGVSDAAELERLVRKARESESVPASELEDKALAYLAKRASKQSALCQRVIEAMRQVEEQRPVAGTGRRR